MAQLYILAAAALVGIVTGAVPHDCCKQKTVGDKSYYLAGMEETSMFSCLAPCVYKLEGEDEGKMFCFAAGDLEVVCGDGGEFTEKPGGITVAEDAYVTQAKALIDAGTCGSVTASSVCGNDAAGYYNQFEYNGMLVVVSSGAPDHPAEHDQLVSNPNTRCERWQFMQVPLNTAKGSGVATGMGTVGLAVTGGGFFNHLSNPNGALALANEGPTLDSCLGHSAGGGTYHYHANINCTDAGAASGAIDADTCLKIGYYRDGVPVYGFCKDSNGVQMTSCYSLVSGSTTSTVVTISGTYDVASTNTAYEYNPTPDCNLDEGNGAIHPITGQYSYFMTTGYPWVPVNYNGEEGASSLCGLGL